MYWWVCMRARVRACVRVYIEKHKYYMFQVNDKCIIKNYT